MSDKKVKKKQVVKPFNERRVLTRRIARNKLKFELKKMGIQHVNKNFSHVIHHTDLEELINLIDN